MKRKKIYNPESTEKFNEAKPIGGNPYGIINFNKSTSKYFVDIWKGMLNNTWLPKEADVTGDKYDELTDIEKRAFDLALANLIFNDSEQTNNLVDNINPYITDPIINACLTRQAFEEALHSYSYSVMVEDLSANTDDIFNMGKTDPVLREKNDAIAEMYASLSSENPTMKDLCLSFVANNILEGIPFFGGFVTLWSLGGKMPGSNKMINFIARDEVGTHLALFGGIFKGTLQSYPELDTPELERAAKELIDKFVHIEINWLKYITQGQMLGFSDESISNYMKYRGNVVAQNLGYSPPYTVGPNPLKSLEEKNIEFNDTRTNFFEGKVANYSKGDLDMEF